MFDPNNIKVFNEQDFHIRMPAHPISKMIDRQGVQYVYKDDYDTLLKLYNELLKSK